MMLLAHGPSEKSSGRVDRCIVEPFLIGSMRYSRFRLDLSERLVRACGWERKRRVWNEYEVIIRSRQKLRLGSAGAHTSDTHSISSFR